MRKEAIPAGARPRLVVTTDPELDDLNSMIRLLTYANEIDIEGLIYTASGVHHRGNPALGVAPHRWPAPGDRLHIDEAVDAYAQVAATLQVHDPRYPSGEALRALIREGNVDEVGDMRAPTPGSLLVTDLLEEIAHTPTEAVDAEGLPAHGTRPLFLAAWGGINTIARALQDVEERLGGEPEWPAMKQRITDRVLISSFAEQDGVLDTYVRPHWPGLEHRDVATITWGYMTRTVLAPEDLELVSAEWTAANITSRGPLGAAYRVWGDGRQMAEGFDAEDYFGLPEIASTTPEELASRGYTVWCPLQEPGAFISEGDTSTVMALVDNGLRAWEDASYGGWGGRQAQHPLHPDTRTTDMDPFFGERQWERLVVDEAPDGVPAAEWHMARWWRAIQHEFAARLAWSVTPSCEGANHPPRVEVAGDLDRTVRAGERLLLTATAEDPDGDEVTIRWWQYREAGTYPGSLTLECEQTAQGESRLSLTVPEDAEPNQTIHLIAEGTDCGTPALTRYQRLILTVC